MTRLLWPAVATLIIIAIGAPCLTFYLLIKDYWAEVALLRQKLLYCQLTKFDPATFPSLDSTVSWDNLPLQDSPHPQLPNPLPLTSSDVRLPTSTENILAFDAPPRTEPISAIPGEDDQSEDGGTDQNRVQAASQSQTHIFRRFKSSPLIKEDLALDSSASEALSTFGKMISDKPKMTNLQDDEVCLPEEYIDKMEKRIVDLSGRVESCRKCLDVPLQKESRCGGGASWKEFRRYEKLFRKEMREHKRKRRRKEKKEKETNKNSLSKHDDAMTSSSQRRNASSETIFESTNPESGFLSMREWHSDASQVKDTHKIRENHRATTDFRRGFNQKISRMDEALMQFAETQSAFCKELRDNLGSRLEKRGQELESLSEQIAALVRTTTIQVAMLEKLASDQVYAGQTSVEKNLANLQTVRDSQTRAVQDYHKKVFIPAMVTVTSLLGEQASSVTNMGVDLITKVEMLQDVYLNFATKQGDTLVKVSEFVDMFVTKHGNLVMRSRDHAKHLHINTENFIRELQTRMNNVVKELVLVRLQSQSFISVNENTFHEISSSLNKTNDVIETLSSSLHEKVNVAKEEETEFRKAFRKETDLINERIESGISQVLTNNHAAVTQIGEIDLETSVYSERAEAAWNELYSNQETELRQETDMLANNLRSHNHHTQNILTGLQGTAGTHEQVLEQQRMDFQNFIRKRQDALDTQCSSINDWALLMSSELRRRDEDLHRFLSEELRFSPVSVQVTHNYNDYLVSRLPDGTLMYDSSSPSDSSPYPGWQHLNQTSPLERRMFETWTKTGRSQSASKNVTTASLNDSLPVSSLKYPPNTQEPLTLNPDSAKLTNIETIASQKASTMPSQNATEKLKSTLKNDNVEKELLETYSNDSLSNDIEFNEETYDNEIIVTQNDQGVINQSNATKRDCNQNATSLLNLNQNSTEDQDFIKLKDIVMEAKKSILRFQKEFDIKDDFRELKSAVWKRFHDGNTNHSTSRGSKMGRGFFNFNKNLSQATQNQSFKNKTEQKNVNKRRHEASKMTNEHRRSRRRKP